LSTPELDEQNGKAAIFAPMNSYGLPAVRNRLAERILPEADLHRILSLESNPRNRAILTLLYASGIRVSELCGLCWRDVQPNGDGGQITVFGKGGVTRSVQVPASVWKLVAGLSADAGPDEPVFRSRKSQRVAACSPWPFCGWCAMPRSVPGLSCRFRRTGSGTRMLPNALDRGAPIHLVQATLGHANINTTGRYLHARPKDSSSRFLPL